MKCIWRKVAVQGLSLGGRLLNMGWEETSEKNEKNGEDAGTARPICMMQLHHC